MKFQATLYSKLPASDLLSLLYIFLRLYFAFSKVFYFITLLYYHIVKNFTIGKVKLFYKTCKLIFYSQKLFLLQDEILYKFQNTLLVNLTKQNIIDIVDLIIYFHFSLINMTRGGLQFEYL